MRYFCAADTSDKDTLKDNEPKRIALYKLTVGLIRAYANLVNELAAAGYTAQEAEQIKQESTTTKKCGARSSWPAATTSISRCLSRPCAT